MTLDDIVTPLLFLLSCMVVRQAPTRSLERSLKVGAGRQKSIRLIGMVLVTNSVVPDIGVLAEMGEITVQRLAIDETS